MNKALLLSVVGITLFISCSKAANDASGDKRSVPSAIATPDVAVRKIMGDSIADIVFSSKVTAIAYKMSPAETPSDNDHTIGGVKVAKEIGKISKYNLAIMQFLLSDSTAFNGKELVPARPFVANVALEFKLKKESVFILFSFGSCEISAVKNGREVWHHYIGDVRKHLLFFYRITRDQDIEFYLNQLER